MKRTIKIIAYVAFLVLFGLYLWFADYIFYVFVRAGCEGRHTRIELPAESESVKFWVEEVSKANLRWKEDVRLKGWAFQKDNTQEERTSYLVLTSAADRLIFRIDNDTIYRKGVTEYFNMDERFAHLGFDVMVPTFLLKDSVYTIGYAIEDKTGRYFTNHHLELRKKKDKYKLIDLVAEAEPDPADCEVTPEKRDPTSEIVYYFEEVKQSGKALLVKGWGFLNGNDTRNLNTYVVLKKGDRERFYRVGKVLRKGVTSHFSKLGLNLDSAGFSAIIPIRKLEPGNYQVGLYMTKGEKAGVVHPNTFFEVEE